MTRLPVINTGTLFVSFHLKKIAVMRKMLEYQKMIIEKVSFDKKILKREIHKSLKWLSTFEFQELITWLQRKFGPTYADVIYNAEYALPSRRMKP
ncbi:MAG: hypothetical protein C0594_03340 [Marinilabiliales bacterium]|nr:MAG: hypothetical protein C0594_03340 [Marinilabiliales bacterium]